MENKDMEKVSHRFSTKDRLFAKGMYEGGASFNEIARHFKASAHTVINWLFPERRRKHSIKYYAKNKQRLMVGMRKYYQKNREKIKAQHREWYYKRKANAPDA